MNLVIITGFYLTFSQLSVVKILIFIISYFEMHHYVAHYVEVTFWFVVNALNALARH